LNNKYNAHANGVGLTYLVRGCLVVPRKRIWFESHAFLFLGFTALKLGQKQWRPETTLKTGRIPKSLMSMENLKINLCYNFYCYP
jgi:hypothetical protein